MSKRCRCDPPEAVRESVVKKAGKNQGRKFFACSNYPVESCGFFEWVPDEEPLIAGASQAEARMAALEERIAKLEAQISSGFFPKIK